MLMAILWFAGVLLLGLGLDWLACTRVAAYRTDYEYTYRPGGVRYVLLALAAAVFAFVKVTHNPSRQPIVGLLVILGILLAWSLVAARDVRRKLVLSELAPKRYADTDY